MSIATRYTETDEWLAEVKDRAAEVQWGLIRVTALHEFNHPVTAVWLVAGAIVGGQLVELRRRVGSVLMDHERPAVAKKYDAERDRITAEAGALGLKVRPGWFVELGTANGGWR